MAVFMIAYSVMIGYQGNLMEMFNVYRDITKYRKNINNDRMKY